LVACSIIYFLLADPGEAFILLVSAILVIGITFYQERRSERALETLRDLSSPRALVIRGGKKKSIPGREVVNGDLVIVSEGDRVPADAVLVRNSSLEADESLLTGESVPVRKSVWDSVSEFSRPGGSDLPFIYSGTLIIRGQGIAEVRTTGQNTEMGKIGKSLQSVKEEGTKIQIEIKRLVRIIAIAGLSLCLVVAILYGVIRGHWLEGFLAGLSLAMAMLPEEFPVVLTVFLALGAWRMSKRNILARHIPVLETLGETTILCVDKTGTLTENRMVVRELRTFTEVFRVSENVSKALPENLADLAECIILASPIDPFDPMEKAIHSFGANFFEKNNYPARDWMLAREYPLSSELLVVTNAWLLPGASEHCIAAKGAPESIAELCNIHGKKLEILHRQAKEMADEGLRVIGAAKANFESKLLPYRFI
jgi:Ca2+-transporting ATPase